MNEILDLNIKFLNYKSFINFFINGLRVDSGLSTIIFNFTISSDVNLFVEKTI